MSLTSEEQQMLEALILKGALSGYIVAISYTTNSERKKNLEKELDMFLSLANKKSGRGDSNEKNDNTSTAL